MDAPAFGWHTIPVHFIAFMPVLGVHFERSTSCFKHLAGFRIGSLGTTHTVDIFNHIEADSH